MTAGLLAFGFASPWLLWGLVAATLPVLIHLLHRGKLEKTPWAAMRFLLAASEKTLRRIRLEQLLLLLLRTCIIVLTVLALARPYVANLAGLTPDGVPQHQILVVDDSLSMQFTADERSDLQRAQEACRAIVDRSQTGDAFNLVVIRDRSPATVIAQPSFQHQTVLGEIDRLTATQETGDIFAALTAVEQALDKNDDTPNKVVTLLSDFQQTTFAPLLDPQNQSLRERFAKLADRAYLQLVDVADERRPNAAVIDFSTDSRLALTNHPVRLQATLRNFSDNLLKAQSVELLVNGKLTKKKSVDLPPRAEVFVEFELEYREAGVHQLQIHLQPDYLAVDNDRYLVMSARDELNVLLVNGRVSGKVMGRATDYLQLALDPSLPTSSWRGLIRPQVVNDTELPGVDLARFDAVCLCNVSMLTEQEAGLIEQYVRQGGGLVVTLGDQVVAENYNQVWHRAGQGFLPAALADRVGSADQPDQIYEFAPSDYTHPILRVFAGNPSAGLETTKIHCYFRTVLPAETTAQVVLRYDTGDPVLLDYGYGQGRVLLLTTSVDRDWGSFPVWPSFPPLMSEMMFYVIENSQPHQRLLVGDAIQRGYPGEAFDAKVTVVKPDGQEQTWSLDQDQQLPRLNFEATEQSGVYDVRLGAPTVRRDLFAVNVDPSESDLQAIAADQLAGLFSTDHIEHYQTMRERLWTDPHRQHDGARGELTYWMLSIVLVLLFVEQLLAWRFWAGGLLFACLLLGVLWSAFSHGEPFLLPVVFGGMLMAVAVGAARRLRDRSHPTSEQANREGFFRER